MGILLDTHALIWWVAGDARIRPPVRALLSEPDGVYVSAASAWEIATKVRLRKLKLPGQLLHDFVQATEALGFLPLPILLQHGYDAGQLPGAHRDPFDRMLAAQARAESLMLVTSDPAFRALGVTTFW